MAKTSTMDKVGSWTFMGGLFIAVIVSVFAAFTGTVITWAATLLAVLGIIVGILNVSPTETQRFLLAAIAFLLSFNALNALAAELGNEIQSLFGTFFSMMSAFVAPAAAIVAIVAIYYISRD